MITAIVIDSVSDRSETITIYSGIEWEPVDLDVYATFFFESIFTENEMTVHCISPDYLL